MKPSIGSNMPGPGACSSSSRRSPKARTAWWPNASSPVREAAFEAAGQYVLEHCDVLLAVWDGREVQVEGGTGQIVARGRAMGKPIVIVRAGNRIPGTRVATSLGEEQGRVLVERLTEERRGDG